MRGGGLHRFASLGAFSEILFGIHFYQLLEIFDWWTKISLSFEKTATVVDETPAFVEIRTMLFSGVVDGVRSHYHKPQSTRVVVVVIIVPG